jgi:hypothetical protein
MAIVVHVTCVPIDHPELVEEAVVVEVEDNNDAKTMMVWFFANVFRVLLVSHSFNLHFNCREGILCSWRSLSILTR